MSLYIRPLPGPEEAETGIVPPPLGWHLLCAPWTHVHVVPLSQKGTHFRLWLLEWVRQHYTSHLTYTYTPGTTTASLVRKNCPTETAVVAFGLVLLEKKGKYIFRFCENDLVWDVICSVLFCFGTHNHTNGHCHSCRSTIPVGTLQFTVHFPSLCTRYKGRIQSTFHYSLLLYSIWWDNP